MFNPLALLLITMLYFSVPVALAYDDNTERRISIGLRLFRTLLASDNKLHQKVDQHNQLNLLLISSNNISSAQLYADELLNIGRNNKKGKIHTFPINISTITVSQLNISQQSPVAGIYIIDKLTESQLQTLIDYGISKQIIIYSPFEGDVLEGILAGLAVGVKVRPFINRQTLDKSQLIIKPLFLKVAKIHED